MARYKVTFGFVKYTMGPTENYVTPDWTSTQANDGIQNMMTARNAMLFTDWLWAGVRISDAVNKQRSVFYPPGSYHPFGPALTLNVPSNGTYAPGGTDNRSDQTRAVMQIRLTYDTDRRVIRYLSGVPDGILKDEPASLNFTDFPTWVTRYNTWTNILINAGWSIRARNRGTGFSEIPITNWTQAAGSPTNLGVVIPDAPPSGITAGQFVSIKGVRRKGTDTLSYNGRYVVDSINTTLIPGSLIVYLRGTESGEPASIKLLGTIQRIGYTYFPIQQVEAIRAGIHKRGKPLGTPLGRRKKRLSLDP